MFKKLFFLTMIVSSFMLSAFAVILLFTYLLGPPDTNLHQQTQFFDRDENLLETQALVNQREYIAIEEISPHVKNAFTAAEDQHFTTITDSISNGLAALFIKMSFTKINDKVPVQLPSNMPKIFISPMKKHGRENSKKPWLLCVWKCF